MKKKSKHIKNISLNNHETSCYSWHFSVIFRKKRFLTALEAHSTQLLIIPPDGNVSEKATFNIWNKNERHAKTLRTEGASTFEVYL